MHVAKNIYAFQLLMEDLSDLHLAASFSGTEAKHQGGKVKSLYGLHSDCDTRHNLTVLCNSENHTCLT